MYKKVLALGVPLATDFLVREVASLQESQQTQASYRI